MRTGSLFITLFIAAGACMVSAQNNHVFTLQQCLDYALKESVPVKNAELDERIAKARVNETIGIGLPQINGSVALDHNQQLRRFLLPTIRAARFSPTRYPASKWAMWWRPVTFQLRSTGDASIRVNQLLFNGSYLVGLRQPMHIKSWQRKVPVRPGRSYSSRYQGILCRADQP